MKEIKILAQSLEGEGMLPMKQSKELEAKKSNNQKNEEFCNFLKNAFCVDGIVQCLESEVEMKSKIFFLLEDSKRGKFLVAIKQI